MAQSIQTLILSNLLQNEGYMRQVIPFLKKDYFEGAHRIVFDTIVAFVVKYNKLPTPQALNIEIQNSDLADAHDPDVLDSILTEMTTTVSDSNMEWLVESTEKFCQDRAIFLAIMESISIIDGNHKTLTKNALPDLLSNAISVSFDTSVGHDYINDAEERYGFYHKIESRIPFDLKLMNKITGGGLPPKSLSVILATTGAGKTLFMTHVSASTLMMGKNVLYITMEMAEERIAERIDANLMGMPINQLKNLDKGVYESKIAKIASKSIGKLIIKEYPTGSAHVGHFRALISELKLKKKFIPDIIFIDYLNICASSRVKAMGGSINSYSYVKAIAEEIRGLAVENNVAIVTATQSNRDAFGSSEVDLNNTSESFGVPATADLMFALVRTEELDSLDQVMIKQLKNRYNDPTLHKRFVLGIDKACMKLYDVEETAQTLISDLTGTSNKADRTKDFSSIKIDNMEA